MFIACFFYGFFSNTPSLPKSTIRELGGRNMDAQKVDLFISSNAKYFPGDKVVLIKKKMSSLDDDRYLTITSIEYKDPTTMLLVSIFLGSLGIDRFMLGETGMGLLKLFTCGLCGILTIVDWFSISKKCREKNFEKLMMSI